MGNQQNLPHHGNLKTRPTFTSRNQFTEKQLLSRMQSTCLWNFTSISFGLSVEYMRKTGGWGSGALSTR
jgi:hypothetical protein